MAHTSAPSSSKSESFMDRLNHVVHEGNIRHLVVSKRERQVVDLPLTVVVVAALLAPWLAVIGLVVALATGWKMDVLRVEVTPVERETPSSPAPETPPAAAVEQPAAASEPAEVPASPDGEEEPRQ